MTARTTKIPHLSRRGFLASAGIAGCLALAGCAAAPGDGSAQGSAGSSAPAAGPRTVKIGTMMTEDFLPGWVAERDGLFGSDTVVAIETFQSAQELTAALTAGAIDMAMTDPQVSASITAGGTPVELCWIALGATPSQGRFGIQVGPDSDIESVEQLRGASIAVGSNTVPEFVMCSLLERAGINDGDYTKEEVKKLPVRFEMMSSGKVDAAALPASLLALGESKGCRTIVDDTTGDNLSQSVMVVREDFADTAEGAAAVQAVRKGWNEAARLIDADPENYRDLLVEKTGLAGSLAAGYPIPEYPVDAAPTKEMIQPQLDWMLQRGYLEKQLTYDEQNGIFEE